MKESPKRRFPLEASRGSAVRWISLIGGAVFWRVVEDVFRWEGAAAVGYGAHLTVHFALATRALAPRRRWLLAAATGLIGGALAALARLCWVAARNGSFDFGYGVAASLPTLPWWVLFSLAGAAVGSGPPAGGLVRRLAHAFAVAAALYVASFLLVFDIRGGEAHPYVEHADASGRPPVVGPKVTLVGSLLCPGTGPCFLWSCDHVGNEWIFRFWKPLVGAWFRANSGKFHNPDHPDST